MREFRYVPRDVFEKLVMELSEDVNFVEYIPCNLPIKIPTSFDVNSVVRTLTIGSICYVEEKEKV